MPTLRSGQNGVQLNAFEDAAGSGARTPADTTFSAFLLKAAVAVVGGTTDPVRNQFSWGRDFSFRIRVRGALTPEHRCVPASDH